MPKNILIIEDEIYLLDMYREKFERMGYKVTTAENGQEGIKKAEKEKPSLVLLDLVLPGINGFEVLKKLKKNKKTKNLIVYILSNLGQNGDIKKSFDRGADGYLIKSSLTPSELVHSVSKIFDGKKVGVKEKR